MSVEIVAQLVALNSKMSQVALEVHTLCTHLAKSPTPINLAGQDDGFDKEFETAKETPIPGHTLPNAAPGAERDNAGAGVPWDERIHAKTKTKTVKGMWKRGKGVTSDLYTTVMAELTAVYVSDPVPTVPGIAPTVPVVDSPDKANAMASIAILSDEFGVDYSLILKALKETFSVEQFDGLAQEQYPFAAALFERWVTGVRECDEEAEMIVEFGGTEGAKGLAQLYANNYIKKLSDLTHLTVADVKAKLSDYRVQWENYANAQ